MLSSMTIICILKSLIYMSGSNLPCVLHILAGYVKNSRPWLIFAWHISQGFCLHWAPWGMSLTSLTDKQQTCFCLLERWWITQFQLLLCTTYHTWRHSSRLTCVAPSDLRGMRNGQKPTACSWFTVCDYRSFVFNPGVLCLLPTSMKM